MSFKYNKKDACCMWCNRTKNPHPDYNETIPTKIFISKKKRKVELCLYCYEEDVKFSKRNTINFNDVLDQRYEILNSIQLHRS